MNLGNVVYKVYTIIFARFSITTPKSNANLDSLSIHNRETLLGTKDDKTRKTPMDIIVYDYTLRKVRHLRKSMIDIIKKEIMKSRRCHRLMANWI